MAAGRKDIDSLGNDVPANSQSAEIQDLTGGKSLTQMSTVSYN